MTASLPTHPARSSILVEVAPGELIDKITILEIKLAHISDPDKLKNVRTEYDILTQTATTAIPATPDMQELTAQLKHVNEVLWQVEDDIRDCERQGDFGPRFIELARSVYRTNDERARLKREINSSLNSSIIEEKSYAQY